MVASPVLQPPIWGSTHFSRLLRHAWATVRHSLQLFPYRQQWNQVHSYTQFL